MGDHRASIKIEFSFRGKTETCDMWINYSPSSSECDGVDQRVIDFFRKHYEAGMERYNNEMVDYWAENKKKQERESELRELERLKAKYELGGK